MPLPNVSGRCDGDSESVDLFARQRTPGQAFVTEVEPARTVPVRLVNDGGDAISEDFGDAFIVDLIIDLDGDRITVEQELAFEASTGAQVATTASMPSD